MDISKSELMACGIGIFIGGMFTMLFMGNLLPTEDKYQHPIGYSDTPEEVHVHSDFVLFLDGEEIDLSDDKYQSDTAHIMHADIHLHGNDDEVIHRHDHGITLGVFFGSIGFDLTPDCITSDTETLFCTDDYNELMVFVNDERIEDLVNYVNKEEDRILIYFGDKDDSETIKNLLLSITNKSCIYSGTCPERGTAPPESCGLTCEM
ncbi:MAG: hypothetical protein ACI9BF_000592 [Candidatus Paceibacteria bacterium]|jgi:hypothetical protein